MFYSIGPIPADAAPWIARELRAIAEAIAGGVPFVKFDTLYAQPKKIAEGLTVKADGATWNPGSGAGVYCYRGGAWRFLG
jgi:hypothetical protein